MPDNETGVQSLKEVGFPREAGAPVGEPRAVIDGGLTARPSGVTPQEARLALPPERLAAVRLLAMDVDGVLTDGTIVWSARPQGGAVLETKSFSVRDGLGLSMARIAGLQVAWITGRTSSVVERRAIELGVTELHQWARNKALVLEEIKGRHALPAAAVAFIGDDLNDVPAFKSAGLRIAVADAAAELQA